MSRFRLSRRMVLRGMAGAAVALPPLEIMGERWARAAAAPPRRFILAYAGVSHGSYGVPIEQSLVVPKTVGAGYELTNGLKSIEGGAAWKVGDPGKQDMYTSVKADVGVVTGLKIPWGTPIPPAGRSDAAGFHGTTMRSQISGETMVGTTESTIQGTPRGLSADQIVSDAIKGSTPHAIINLRAQASYYYGANAANDSFTLSYRNRKWNTPIKSLRLAYNTLFSVGGTVDGKPIDVASFVDRRKSILDAVTEKSKWLLPRLGSGDRMRLEKHYEEIRALETTLETLNPSTMSGVGACDPAAAPVDPPIGDGYFSTQDDLSKLYASGEMGWSNEELRAQVMGDFLYLLIKCDRTRSAIFHLTLAQSTMNAYHLTTNHAATDLHNAGHGGAGGTLESMAEIVAWHVKHFSRLVARLRDSTEVDGSRVIDHCAMSMLWEGGHGSSDGDPNRNNDAHSTENMIVVVAGGAGGLKSGQHVHFKNDRHPGQVVLTHMQAVGVPDTQPFGEIKEPLPELFRPG